MEHIIAPIASRLHIQEEQIIKTLQLLKEYGSLYCTLSQGS